MTEWNPQVIKIGEIYKVPNSDFLYQTTVLGGYVVIFKENQFKTGDLASYIPVDTVCPNSKYFEFLGDKKRIKAKKLRGVFSLGLLIEAPPNMMEGDFVIDYFNLTKYVYEEEQEALGHLRGNSSHHPKGWNIPYYELKALRQYHKALVPGEEVILTEKIEGCNIAVGYDLENNFWVKSRNIYLKEDEYNLSNNMYWKTVTNYDLKNRLTSMPGYIFFFELYGQVKKFTYDCFIKNNIIYPKLRLFDIWDIKNMKYLNWSSLEEISKMLKLETVPVLYRGPWTPNYIENNIQKNDLWKFAEGKSTIGDCVREGFVLKTPSERFDNHFNRIALKHKGEDYYMFKK